MLDKVLDVMWKISKVVVFMGAIAFYWIGYTDKAIFLILVLVWDALCNMHINMNVINKY